MSALDNFYKTTFTVSRSSIVSDTSIDGFSFIGSYAGLIRQITDKTKLYNRDDFGNEFNLWCGFGTPIKANDRVTVGSDIYSCVGVQDFEDLEDGGDSHKQIILSKK